MNYVIGYVSLVYKHYQYCLISFAINIVSHITGNGFLQIYHVKPHFHVCTCIMPSNSVKAY